MKEASDGSQSAAERPVDRNPVPRAAGERSRGDESAASPEPDMVFRVSLRGLEQPTGSLDQYYGEQLRDLLRVVRLHFKGKPVLVDSFTFLNRPDRQIPVPRERGAGPE